MKLIKNLLLSIFNNIGDSENNSIMVVKNEADLRKLIEDAQKSKLNPMASSGIIPFGLNTQTDLGIGIDSDNVIGTMCNFSILEGQHGPADSLQPIFYLVADIVIDDNFHMLIAPMIIPVQGTEFYALKSDMMAFGLRGITSRIGHNVEEVMQIITFDLILNTGSNKFETPIIDDSTPASVETIDTLVKAKPKAEPEQKAKQKTKSKPEAEPEKSSTGKKKTTRIPKTPKTPVAKSLLE